MDVAVKMLGQSIIAGNLPFSLRHVLNHSLFCSYDIPLANPDEHLASIYVLGSFSQVTVIPVTPRAPNTHSALYLSPISCSRN